VLYDCGLVHTPEPFQKLFNQGMVLAYSYRDPRGKYYHPDEVEEREDGRAFARATGEELLAQVEKMSKSKLNVVNPDEVIERYGADAMRLYEMFMGPLEVSKPWSTKGIVGIKRFIERIWRVSELPASNEPAPEELLRLLHKTVKKVTQDTQGLAFNTAISQMMIFVSECLKQDHLFTGLWKNFILVLSPYAPHLAEELWEKCGETPSACLQPWPAWSEDLTIDDVVEVVCQINGKVRARLQVRRGLGKQEIQELALKEKRIAELTASVEIIKIIVVPDKLVNIVVKG
jgi:leucyl-tRNA synthetase